MIVQKTINDVTMITDTLANSYFMLLRGSIFGLGGTTAILYYFPNIAILTLLYLGVFGLRSSLYYRKIQEASKDQISYLEEISKNLGQFATFRRSVFLSKAKDFCYQFFSKNLYKNHEKISRLGSLRGNYVLFLETFGIGYILSVISYITYLSSIGFIQAEDLALSIFALYAALGLRSLNYGLSELREKLGILESMEQYLNTDLTEDLEIFEVKDKFFLSEQLLKYIEFEKYVLKNFEKLNYDQISSDLEEYSKEVEEFLSNQLNKTNINVYNLKIHHSINDSDKFVEIDDLKLENGKILGLKGRSGIGKTSLIDMILGFRTKGDGDIIIDTERKHEKPRFFYFTQIPEIFERNFIFNTIISNLDLVTFILENQNFSKE